MWRKTSGRMTSVHCSFRRRVTLTVSVAAIFGTALLVTARGVLKGGSAQVPKLLFSGNWETGDISQWTWGAQCANYAPSLSGSITRGNLSIVTDVVAQGMYSARFDLPADVASNNACEVLRKRTEALGTDDWYAQEVYFPSNWREPSGWGLLLGQYDYQGITGPPVGLVAHANYVDLGI